MKIKEPTRKHPEIKQLTRRQSNMMTKKLRPFEVVCLALAGILTIVICCYYTWNWETRKVPSKPVAGKKRIVTNRQRQETTRAEEKPAEPVRSRKMRKVKRNSVELFPIEEMKVLKDPSSSVWSLVGTVRNNTDHPVKGIVRIRFVNKTGYVFHKSQNIVAGPKGITAIQTGEIPLLPEPEWIRPGEFGWFIHPEDHIVFEEAANIEVTFEKVSN